MNNLHQWKGVSSIIIRIKNKIKIESLRPFFYLSWLSQNIIRHTETIPNIKELSIEDICSLYPKRIKNLFAHLDLERQGLEQVKIEIQKEKIVDACKSLIEYYRGSNTIEWLRQPSLKTGKSINLAVETIVNNTFTFQQATKLVNHCQGNLLNWIEDGPEGDREWTFFLNRHYHFLNLLESYQKNRNPIYIETIRDHLIDWIISNPSLKILFSRKQWRGLEVAFRITHWAPCFYALQQDEEFSDAVRLLMLSSILDHSYYLRYLHSWGANWLTREMYGLATAALCWPEFRDSERWSNYAINTLFREINIQVYPDGVHKELTSHYHLFVLQNFQHFADLLKNNGIAIPENFSTRLEQMWSYLAYSMCPDGHSLLNNDSDRDNTSPLIYQAADSYQRPDWAYIASNGKMGQRPSGIPSTIFSWAGQLISRNGWERTAHWAFFDLGSAGINYHIHNDKLHLSLAAFGRDLLVDSGRYRYVRDKFWHYFRGSASHNVILIDGKFQKTSVRELYQPLSTDDYAITSEFDFAIGKFDEGYINLKGKSTHSRAFLYLRDRYWIVVDRIVTDRPRKIEVLWHFHPDCTVIANKQSVESVDPDVGNLKIVPASDLLWNVQIIQGQENPVQGWWSREYNHKTPNPTAVYTTTIESSKTFAWVLAPAQGIVHGLNVNVLPSPEGSVLLKVKASNQTVEKIAVNMVGKHPIDLDENLKLEGRCAVLRPAQKPLVALGRIIDLVGNTISEHKTDYL
jgi:Heparinase II/III N-terminus/Heparinase II/III-like protein